LLQATNRRPLTATRAIRMLLPVKSERNVNNQGWSHNYADGGGTITRHLQV
jgi:hypothetical protein